MRSYTEINGIKVDNKIFTKKFCCDYDKGERDGVFLLDFLRNPLIRGFGKKFYDELKDVQKMFL